MTRPSTDIPQWAVVDEGWGRKAVDFATLSEPGNCVVGYLARKPEGAERA
jgi:hypothetical protein